LSPDAGRNLALDDRGFTLSNEQFPVHAVELAAEPVDVIFAAGRPATRAARDA
jgi:hypothetical protein